MAYFIKETYPEINSSVPSNVLFKAWINHFQVKESYTNWNLTGNVYIFSNTYLPNYSYYLNIDSFLFNVKDINLIYQSNYIKKNIMNSSEQAYVIDIYDFDININMSSSSFINKDIYNQDIEISFYFNFNQNIFNDFSISCNEKNRKNFIDCINRTHLIENIKYSNISNLEDEINYVSINNNSNEDDLVIFKINNFFNLDQPINNLFEIKKNDYLPFWLRKIEIKLKYKLTDNDNWYEYSENIENINFITDYYVFALNKAYDFDIDKNTINISFQNKNNGIFIPKKVIGYIDINLQYEYKKVMRKAIINRQFSFNNNYYEASIKVIKLTNTNKTLNDYVEVCND